MEANELLNNLAELLKEEMRQQLKIANHIMTGELVESIESRILSTIEGRKIEIWLNSYGIALDQGVPPDRIPFTEPSIVGSKLSSPSRGSCRVCCTSSLTIAGRTRARPCSRMLLGSSWRASSRKSACASALSDTHTRTSTSSFQGRVKKTLIYYIFINVYFCCSSFYMFLTCNDVSPPWATSTRLLGYVLGYSLSP